MKIGWEKAMHAMCTSYNEGNLARRDLAEWYLACGMSKNPWSRNLSNALFTFF